MKTRLSSDSWVLTRPIAHRGLWSDTVPENSLSAYALAVENNIPIEMDIQMSTAGDLFCFHDDNAKRMTGVDKDIRTMSTKEIEALVIGGEKVPTFKELLTTVNGKVPILIEIKQQLNKGVEQKTVDELKGYTGEYAIQSFDPTIMLRIKKLVPDVLRGQLGVGNTNKGLKWKIVRNLSLNFLVKPDFVHYCVDNLPISDKVSNGLPVICWTVNTPERLEKAKKYAKNFVFETIKP